MIKYKQCPKCGSKKTMTILYGEPVYALELMQKESEGKIKFGGCIVMTGAPEYSCKEYE